MDATPANLPRVLLVDDTPASLFALSAVLKPLGAELVEARSGEEALECVRTMSSFAVVLLDVQMPGIDGFETAARIRTLEGGADLPIIFLTAIHRDERYARKGYATGAADYITKPYDADVLRARVKAFVDLFRQREELRRRDVEIRTHERDEAVRRLAAFERIATAALAEGDLDAFLRRLLAILMEAADSAEFATILLREGDVLRVRASVGQATEHAASATAIGQGFAGTIAATGEPLFMGEGSTPLFRGSAGDRSARGMFGVPLMHDGSVIGVAQIGSRRSSDFSDVERRLLIAMAERAAWAVARRFRMDRFQAVLMTAPALAAILRVPGYACEFGNTAFRSLFGDRSVLGVAMTDLGVPADLVATLDRVASTGESVSVSERPIKMDWAADGKIAERVFTFALQPLRNQEGHVEAIMVFATEVTAQVRAREELEKAAQDRAVLLDRERIARAEAEFANRAKDDFLATVSHELRTPLNAILGWTLIARRQAPPSLQRALGIIERNARSQTRIIEDVLDVSRVISGKLRLEITGADVAASIEGALEAVRPAAEAKGVALAATIGDLGVIAADADRLQQVAWNVLSNAIKFTPRGGRVELTATRTPRRVVIVVRDSGEGMSPSFLPHLFEPFRQADGSTTRRHGGLGLGLAIVKQLVQAHGGTIVAESAGPGEGSVFTIELPIRTVTAETQVSTRVGASSGVLNAAGEDYDGRLDGLRILVVEDEEEARLFLEEIFSERGASVTLAANAREGLDRLARVRPDVIVSDIGMPEMDGFAFMRQVRQLSADEGGRSPAIALTAYAHADDAQRAFAAGFQVHLAKPVDPASLVAAVAGVVGLPNRASSSPAPSAPSAPSATSAPSPGLHDGLANETGPTR